MSYNYIDVEVLVNDKPIKKLAHDSKIFVEAKDGSEYTIKIRNNYYSRKLVVCAVDGINVIDGKAAGSTKAGYVVNGLTTLEVKGFRVSNETVNAFKFARKSKSYAAKSEETGGDTTNCGVIGIQVFDEKAQPVPYVINNYHNNWYPKRRMVDYPSPTWTAGTPGWTDNTFYGASSFDLLSNSSMEKSRGLDDSGVKCSCSMLSSVEDSGDIVQDMAAFDLGTEFSKKEVEDKVNEVEFEIGTELKLIEIYYASRQALVKMGVPVQKEGQVVFPKAFPSKFCKPPK